MPKNISSPYASSFKSAIKRGIPCFQAVQAIAKRTNKSTNTIFASLHKAEICYRQKFNGTWIYWPCEPGKSNATNKKYCQTNMWQWFVDWCICNDICNPEQISKCTSQADFMKYCRKYFGNQYISSTSGTSGKRTGRKRATSTSRRRRTTTGRTSANYRIGRKSSSSRRYRRAA